MKKIVLFSIFLISGLICSQTLPNILGDTTFNQAKPVFDSMLYVCLAFIMINVGREFELDKSKWRSYTADYFIAMATAAAPWLLICFYYMVLLPSECMERDPSAQPFCRTNLGRNPVHYVGGSGTEIIVDI